MLSIELINLYCNMFALANHSTMSPVIPPTTLAAVVISTLFARSACIKHKNLV